MTNQQGRAPAKGSTSGWVDYLSRVELPVLAQTLKEISELTDNSNSTVNQLADVILKDADLTSQVLRLSNTVFYNQTRTSVSTVSRAITLIGFDSVKAMAISSLVIDSLLTKNPRIHLLRCLARALHAAVQARCLLPKLSEERREQVFIGALLSNIGEMAFWSCRTPQADELDAQLHQEDAAAAQRRILGTTFVSITRGLADAWSLGPFVKDVVSGSSTNSGPVSLVRNALILVEAAEQGWRHPDVDRVLGTLSEQLGESVATLRDQVRLNAKEAANIAVTYGMRQITSLLPDQDADLMVDDSLQPHGDPILQLQILRELSALMVERPDINLVFQTVVEGLHRAVGLGRVALLMRERQQGRFTARKVLGDGSHHWREKFVVETEAGDFLAALSRSRLSYAFVPEKDPNFNGLALPSFDRHIGRRPGLFGPLFVGDRLVAMIYADNGELPLAAGPDQFQAFSHFVQQAQLCLNSLAENKPSLG